MREHVPNAGVPNERINPKCRRVAANDRSEQLEEFVSSCRRSDESHGKTQPRFDLDIPLRGSFVDKFSEDVIGSSSSRSSESCQSVETENLTPIENPLPHHYSARQPIIFDSQLNPVFNNYHSISHRSSRQTEIPNDLGYRLVDGWDKVAVTTEEDDRDVFPLNRPIIRGLARVLGLLQNPTSDSSVTDCSAIDWTLLERPDEDFELVIDKNQLGIGGELGRGTYGVVRRVKHLSTGIELAVKTIPKESVHETCIAGQVENEVRVQLQLNHPNVLRCYSCIDDVQCIHLIMECCSEGDLYGRVRQRAERRLTEEEGFFYFIQLVNGLRFIHSRGFCHRDLKLENLLLSSDYVLKIADFGWVASILGTQNNFNFCGTLDYLAPEMVQGHGHDWRVDLWGAGVLLYEMLTGKPPFQSTRHYELITKILSRRLVKPQWLSVDAMDLIDRFLQIDVNQRMTFEECLCSPWVVRMWKTLFSRSLNLHFISATLTQRHPNDIHHPPSSNPRRLSLRLASAPTPSSPESPISSTDSDFSPIDKTDTSFLVPAELPTEHPPAHPLPPPTFLSDALSSSEESSREKSQKLDGNSEPSTDSQFHTSTHDATHLVSEFSLSWSKSNSMSHNRFSTDIDHPSNLTGPPTPLLQQTQQHCPPSTVETEDAPSPMDRSSSLLKGALNLLHVQRCNTPNVDPDSPSLPPAESDSNSGMSLAKRRSTFQVRSGRVVQNREAGAARRIPTLTGKNAELCKTRRDGTVSKKVRRTGALNDFSKSGSTVYRSAWLDRPQGPVSLDALKWRRKGRRCVAEKAKPIFKNGGSLRRSDRDEWMLTTNSPQGRHHIGEFIACLIPPPQVNMETSPLSTSSLPNSWDRNDRPESAPSDQIQRQINSASKNRVLKRSRARRKTKLLKQNDDQPSSSSSGQFARKTSSECRGCSNSKITEGFPTKGKPSHDGERAVDGTPSNFFQQSWNGFEASPFFISRNGQAADISKSHAQSVSAPPQLHSTLEDRTSSSSHGWRYGTPGFPPMSYAPYGRQSENVRNSLNEALASSSQNNPKMDQSERESRTSDVVSPSRSNGERSFEVEERSPQSASSSALTESRTIKKPRQRAAKRKPRKASRLSSVARYGKDGVSGSSRNSNKAEVQNEPAFKAPLSVPLNLDACDDSLNQTRRSTPTHLPDSNHSSADLKGPLRPLFPVIQHPLSSSTSTPVVQESIMRTTGESSLSSLHPVSVGCLATPRRRGVSSSQSSTSLVFRRSLNCPQPLHHSISSNNNYGAHPTIASSPVLSSPISSSLVMSASISSPFRAREILLPNGNPSPTFGTHSPMEEMGQIQYRNGQPSDVEIMGRRNDQALFAPSHSHGMIRRLKNESIPTPLYAHPSVEQDTSNGLRESSWSRLHKTVDDNSLAKAAQSFRPPSSQPLDYSYFTFHPQHRAPHQSIVQHPSLMPQGTNRNGHQLSHSGFGQQHYIEHYDGNNITPSNGN